MPHPAIAHNGENETPAFALRCFTPPSEARRPRTLIPDRDRCKMPYDLETAERLRTLLEPRAAFVEKKMFGGIGFLLGGNMCCGVWKEFLILRVGPEQYDDALTQDGAREFDITGRAMTGWVMVEPHAFEHPADLKRWLARATQFVATLPVKGG